MRESGAFRPGTDLVTTLEFFFQSCSIEVDAQMLAVVAASLANAGVCPLTEDAVFTPGTVQACLSLMSSCGMYDFSGEFAFTIGLPAKSGVSGAVMLVIPGLMGICVWSPRLDEHGNSVRGIEFCRQLVAEYNVHVFDSLGAGRGQAAKRDPRRKKNQTQIEAVVALTWAASQGDLNEVRALVATGVEPGTADYDGRTPLHLAAAEGQPEVVRYLLAAGAGPQPTDRWGGTPAVRRRSQRPHPDRSAAPPAHRRQRPPSPSRRQARGSSGMSDNDVAGARVVAVLLADGWHRIVPGSFRVGPLSFGAEAGPGTPGFRFEEAEAGRPYQPTVLAGALDSIIAVRQVTPATRRIGDLDQARAAHEGQRADQGAQLRIRAGR